MKCYKEFILKIILIKCYKEFIFKIMLMKCYRQLILKIILIKCQREFILKINVNKMLQRSHFKDNANKTLQRIPNLVLTSTLPNGTVKLAQRNASINSTNQTSLAAILALNHATNAKFAPLSESQAFITSSISSLGKSTALLFVCQYLFMSLYSVYFILFLLFIWWYSFICIFYLIFIFNFFIFEILFIQL